jgi:hypothetical protein
MTSWDDEVAFHCTKSCSVSTKRNVVVIVIK